MPNSEPDKKADSSPLSSSHASQHAKYGFIGETSMKVKAFIWGPDSLTQSPSNDPNTQVEPIEPESFASLATRTSTRLKAFFVGAGGVEANIDELPEHEWLTADIDQEASHSAPNVEASDAVEPSPWTMPDSQATQQEKKIKREYLSKAAPKREVVRARKSRTDLALKKPVKFAKVEQFISAHKIKLVASGLALCLVFIAWLIGHSLISDQLADAGLKQLSNGNVNEALSSLNQSIQIDGRNTKAYRYRGDAYRRNGELQKAFADYSSSLKLFPNSISVLNSRANLCLQLHDYSQAVADYTSILGLAGKEQPEIYNKRGDAYAALGQFDKALQDYSVVLKADAKDLQALAGSAASLLQLGRYSDALVQYNLILRKDPHNSAAFLGRSTCYLKEKNFVQTRKEIENPQSQQLSKDYKKAVSDYTAAIALAPKDYALYLERAQCYQQLKSYKMAIDDCTTAAGLNPRAPEIFCLRGTIMEQFGNPLSALTDFTTAISIDKDNVTAYICRGRSFLAKKDFVAAQKDFDHALKLDPTNLAALQGRKDTLSASAPPKAMAQLVANDTPGFIKMSTPSLLRSGYETLKRGAAAEATAMFSEAIRRNRNDSVARRYLAYALLQDNRPSESIEQFQALNKLGALRPADRQAVVRAQQLQRQLQTQTATSTTGGATSTATTPAATAATGQAPADKGIPYLKKLAEASPHDVSCKYNLAQAYAKEGMTAESTHECLSGLNMPEATEEWRKKLSELLISVSNPKQ